MELRYSKRLSGVVAVLFAALLAAVMLLCIPQGFAQAVETDSGAAPAKEQVGSIDSGAATVQAQVGSIDSGKPAMTAQASSKSGVKSSCALLAKDGNLYPCDKKGKKLGTYWKAGSTIKYLFVAANTTKIPEKFNYRYYSSVTYSSTVSMKLVWVKFLLKGGKNSCKTICAESPLAGQTTLKSLKNFNKTKVTAIKDYGLAQTGLTSISLPKTLKSIGAGAFVECTKLSKVKGLDKTKVKKLGDYAFAGCPKIKSIALPKTCTKLGAGAFNRCTALKTIKMPAKRLVAAGASIIGYTPIDSNGAGAIYVPKALIPQYQRAANWSYYASNFKAL